MDTAVLTKKLADGQITLAEFDHMTKINKMASKLDSEAVAGASLPVSYSLSQSSARRSLSQADVGSLSSAVSLNLLQMVKSGMMTVDEAVAEAQVSSDGMAEFFSLHATGYTSLSTGTDTAPTSSTGATSDVQTSRSLDAAVSGEQHIVSVDEEMLRENTIVTKTLSPDEDFKPAPSPKRESTVFCSQQQSQSLPDNVPAKPIRLSTTAASEKHSPAKVKKRRKLPPLPSATQLKTKSSQVTPKSLALLVGTTSPALTANGDSVSSPQSNLSSSLAGISEVEPTVTGATIDSAIEQVQKITQDSTQSTTKQNSIKDTMHVVDSHCEPTQSCQNERFSDYEVAQLASKRSRFNRKISVRTNGTFGLAFGIAQNGKIVVASIPTDETVIEVGDLVLEIEGIVVQNLENVQSALTSGHAASATALVLSLERIHPIEKKVISDVGVTFASDTNEERALSTNDGLLQSDSESSTKSLNHWSVSKAQQNESKEMTRALSIEVSEADDGLRKPRGISRRRRSDGSSSDDSKFKTAYSIKQRKARAEAVEARLLIYEEDIAEWLSTLFKLSEPLNAHTLLEELESGSTICRLAAEVHHGRNFCDDEVVTGWRYPFPAATPTGPDAPPTYKVSAKKGTFQARDNVANFITWATAMGCPCLFESEDLVLRKSDMDVLYCLMDVARGASGYLKALPSLVRFELEADGRRSVISEAAEIITQDDEDDEDAHIAAVEKAREETERQLNEIIACRNFQQAAQKVEIESESRALEIAALEARDLALQKQFELEKATQHAEFMALQRQLKATEREAAATTRKEEMANEMATLQAALDDAERQLRESEARQRNEVENVKYQASQAEEEATLSRKLASLEHDASEARLKAAGSKDNLVPKQLQNRMQDLGIIAEGPGKYRLGKNSLYVRVYKKHIVIRVGGGWDTLENYLFNHYKTREGKRGHILVRDASGVPRWECAPTMADISPLAEVATEKEVDAVTELLRHEPTAAITKVVSVSKGISTSPEHSKAPGAQKAGNVQIEWAGTPSPGKLGGFAKRPSTADRDFGRK